MEACQGKEGEGGNAVWCSFKYSSGIWNNLHLGSWPKWAKVPLKMVMYLALASAANLTGMLCLTLHLVKSKGFSCHVFWYNNNKWCLLGKWFIAWASFLRSYAGQRASVIRMEVVASYRLFEFCKLKAL